MGKPQSPKILASDKKLLIFAAVCIAAGALQLFKGAWGSPRALQAKSRPKLLANIKVTGQVQVPEGFGFTKVVAHLHLPEIPLDIYRRGPELVQDQQGLFAIQTQVIAETKPARIYLTLSAPACHPIEFTKLRLEEEPGATPEEVNLVCNLGLLQLRSETQPHPFVFPQLGAGAGPRSLPIQEPSPGIVFKRRR